MAQNMCTFVRKKGMRSSSYHIAAGLQVPIGIEGDVLGKVSADYALEANSKLLCSPPTSVNRCLGPEGHESVTGIRTNADRCENVQNQLQAAIII